MFKYCSKNAHIMKEQLPQLEPEASSEAARKTAITSGHGQLSSLFSIMKLSRDSLT